MQEIDAEMFEGIAGQFENAEVYYGYSGRCMFGKKCIGISCDRCDVNNVIAEAGAAGIKGARTDSLGKGSIVYWPEYDFQKE